MHIWKITKLIVLHFLQMGQKSRRGILCNTVLGCNEWCITSYIRGHSSIVLSVSFSPDGSKLTSGSGDETVKLWDVTSGELLRTYEEREFLQLCWSCLSPRWVGGCAGVLMAIGRRCGMQRMVNVLHTLEGILRVVNRCRFLSDGTKACVGVLRTIR